MSTELKLYLTLVFFIVQSFWVFGQDSGEAGRLGSQAMANGFFEKAVENFQQAYLSAQSRDSLFLYRVYYLDAYERAGYPEIDSLLDQFFHDLQSERISSDLKSRIYTRLGWINSRINQTHIAFDLTDSAMHFAETPLSHGLALSLKGTLFSMMNNYDESLKRLLQAAQIMEGASYNGKEYGLTLMNISNSYGAIGENVKSGDYLKKAYPPLMAYYGKQHPNYSLVKLFYSQELINRQEYSEAKVLLEDLVDYFRANGDTMSLMHTYHNLSFNNLESGDFKRAQNYYELNLALFEKMGLDNTYNYANILMGWSSCSRDLQDYEKALAGLESLESLCDKNTEISSLMKHNVYILKALILSDQNKFKQADSTYTFAERHISKEFGEGSENMADLHYFMSDNYKLMGEFDKALMYLMKADQYYSAHLDPKSQTLINSLIQRGRIHEAAGSERKALEDYKEAKRRFDEVYGKISTKGDLLTNVQTVTGRDEVYLDLLRVIGIMAEKDQLTEAEWEQAMNLLEEANTYYALLMSRFYKFTETELLITQYHKIGWYGQLLNHIQFERTQDSLYLWNALRIAELTKNFARRIILNDRNAKSMAHIPDSLLQADRDYNRRIQYLEKALDQGEEGVRLELSNLRQEWDDFIQQLEQDYPKYYELKYQAHAMSGKEMQNLAVQSEMAILYFYKSDEDLITYKVNAEGIEYFILQDKPQLDSMVDQFRSAMVGADVSGFYESGSWLYEHLWQTFMAGEALKKVCIVPDQSLSFLNFEALPSSQQPPQSFKDMRYLIEDYNVFYRYELTSAMGKGRNHELSCNNGMAFVPVFDDSHSESKVMELPWSVSLADFMRDNLKVRIYEKNQASKKHFKTDGSKADFLHFSTHAFANDDRPMESYLLFRNREGNLDSLTALEVIESELSASLTSLSACETGISDYKLGFGLQSLAWSFEYAGAENLLVSLWSIDDEITADILKSFYNQVKGSYQSVTDAVRKAKLEALQSADIHQSNPYYWAGMIYVGNDVDIQIASSPLIWGANSLYLLAGVLFCFVLLLYWYFYIKPKNQVS